MRPPKVPRPTPVPRVRSALVDRLADVGAAEVAAFWAGPAARLPLVEPDPGGETCVVTFLLRDPDARRVLLFANRLTDETDLAGTMLDRVPGTDVWHASYRMASDWRASYSFLVQRPGRRAPWEAEGGHVALRAALDRGIADPRNPVTCCNRAGVLQSVVELPAAPPQPWVAPRPGIARGSLSLLRGPDGRRVWVHDPPGAGREDPLPVVVALDGEVWVGPQSLPTTLDNLLADGRTGPVRALLPESGGTDARWRDMGADGGAVEHLVDELLPWYAARRALPRDPASVVVAGQSLGGLTALRAGLLRPDVVGAVAAQSASLWQDDLLGPAAGSGPAAGLPGLRIHLTHGRQEWVLDEPHRRLAAALRAAGHDLHAADHNGGHDYAWWRGALGDALAALLSA